MWHSLYTYTVDILSCKILEVDVDATVYYNQWIPKYSSSTIHIGLNWVLPCNLIPHSTNLIPVDGCSMLLYNTSIHQKVYMVSHQKGCHLNIIVCGLHTFNPLGGPCYLEYVYILSTSHEIFTKKIQLVLELCLFVIHLVALIPLKIYTLIFDLMPFGCPCARVLLRLIFLCISSLFIRI
jgi:hypothetical protein